MFNPWVGKIPWRRKWQPTPVFLPGEFHGQRSLVGYSGQSCQESDTTEQPTLSYSWSAFPFFLVSLKTSPIQRLSCLDATSSSPCQAQGQSSALFLPDFSLPFDTGVHPFLWKTLHMASGPSWSLAPLLATSHSSFWDLPPRTSSEEASDPNHSQELKRGNSSSQILY